MKDNTEFLKPTEGSELIPSREFCEKRVYEQDEYLNQLYERKSTMSNDRYFELMNCAVQRKDYFYSLLNKYYGGVFRRK